MKNIFLFGAGASFGCDGLNSKPPIGKDLFVILQTNFPNTWGALSSEQKMRFGEKFQDFEFGMEYIWNNNSGIIPSLMKDMAVFFSKFHITDKDNNQYIQLLEHILNKGKLNNCIFSTTNYDCLIELAASSLKIPVSYEGPQDGKLNILKLHGSCNFIMNPNEIKAGLGVNYTKEVTFNANLKSIQIFEVQPYCYGNNALYPSMAIYTKGKPLQISPLAIKTFQDYWQKEVLAGNNKIFLIGINPHLEDSHIWDFLSKSESIIYFCGSEASFKKWQNKIKRQYKFIGEKFEQSFEKIKNLI